jgi:bifunctional dethiobiotin synthetase / adenosylmethionine---8-amino-7-oxononanoate aminotransferase
VPTDPDNWSGVPVIFDEVFTGIYRLGRFNCNSFLHSYPDIVVNAKLLTGGLVPLCTTTASKPIYEAFLSDSKADCLLHGHSYTAHPVGCQVAVETLGILESGKLHSQLENKASVAKTSTTYSVWEDSFLQQLSMLKPVKEAWALGTVLAVKLVDSQGGWCSRIH